MQECTFWSCLLMTLLWRSWTLLTGVPCKFYLSLNLNNICLMLVMQHGLECHRKSGKCRRISQCLENGHHILNYLSTPLAVTGYGFYLFVCGSVFCTISKKWQLGSPNWTHKCFTMSPRNPFIWDQKVKGQGHELQKHCWHGSLHCCECWFLLVDIIKMMLYGICRRLLSSVTLHGRPAEYRPVRATPCLYSAVQQLCVIVS